MRMLLKLIVAVLVLLGGVSLAADGGSTGKKPGSTKPASTRPAAMKPGQKMVLKGKTITNNEETGVMVLEENVHVEYPTDKGMMIVECNHMQALMGKDKKLESVHAEGDVRLNTQEYHATAAKATFEFKTNMVVLEGDGTKAALLETADSVSEGQTIRFNLATKSVSMGGGTTELKPAAVAGTGVPAAGDAEKPKGP